MEKYYNKTLILPKARTEKLSLYFTANEFHCRCQYSECCVTVLSKHVLKCLDNLRLLVEAPLYITSAYRCERHNFDVKGKMTSRHLSGEAVDILCPEGFPLKSFETMAKSAGFSYTIGYDNPMRIHADCR